MSQRFFQVDFFFPRRTSKIISFVTIMAHTILTNSNEGSNLLECIFLWIHWECDKPIQQTQQHSSAMAPKRFSFQKVDLMVQRYYIIKRTIIVLVIETDSVFSQVFTYLQFHFLFLFFFFFLPLGNSCSHWNQWEWIWLVAPWYTCTCTIYTLPFP